MTMHTDHHDHGFIHSAGGQAILTAVALFALTAIVLLFFVS